MRPAKTLLRRAICAALLAGLPGAALADMPLTYESDGRALFRLSAPDFWQVRAGGPRAITAPETGEARLINRVIGMEPVADKGVWVGFLSPNGISTLDQAEDYLAGIGRSLVKEPEVTERTSITLGGLPTHRITGIGRRDGRAVSFTALLIDLPTNRVAISLAVIENGANPELVNDVNAIYSSFRAIR
ncbi:hypothetical protein Q5Y75_01490 [Ruegeria sp. 2205SS24-7]|uniref:hypothetical protein n=1 Tax=Ruegeria discodermiae TaxID=3064389 RepID=UPI00274102AC|nr:hypothetical protein [Ruegeria sp. 2205SS24-7]MDP5215882.1 hypothetical protein [Ruegeria sp. 2205SS24-7]